MQEYNFIGYRRKFGVLSIIMVIASLILITVKGVERSVEFAGGIQLNVSFENGEINTGDVRDIVSKVDNKASIVKLGAAVTEEKVTSDFTVKIKNPDPENENEAEISLELFNQLNAAFAEISGETGSLVRLIQTVPQDRLAAKLIDQNPFGLTGTDSEKNREYRELAGKVKSAAESASDFNTLANTVDPERAAKLANGLALMFPALNRTTKDLLGALLQKSDPLGRGTGASYEDIAQALIDYRFANNDFVPSFEDLKAKLTVVTGDDLEKLDQYLRGNFTLGDYQILSNATFSPSIATELLGKAWIAIIMAMIGILLYVAARFSSGYGVASVVALIHDVTISLGFFSLAGAELSNPVVAAFLTIVGYSLNDTIVVFDRIRDNLNATKNPDVAKIMNTSINQTLSRTVVTSLTTLFVVVVIFVASTSALRDFAFPLLVGIIVGTYSSIFVASPILLFWHDKVRKITG